MYSGRERFPRPVPRYLADENIPRVCVTRLLDAGFDVEYVVDRGAGSPDSAVMRRAGEDGRILITEDRDFGALIYAHAQPSPAGVLYLRLGAEPPDAVADAVLHVAASGLPLAGQFTTVSGDGRVRQRPLPG